MKELQVIDNKPANYQPSQLIALAIEKDADVAKLEKLMDLQERWDRNNAKKAFTIAMANFQKDCPVIIKKKSGHNCKYAPIGDIVAQIKDLLADRGLSYRFESNFTTQIQISCIITHIDGHSETTTIEASADSSGNKNQIQAIGSTVTYLQRYSLTGALGITTADEDMDGRLDQASSDNNVTVTDATMLKITDLLTKLDKTWDDDLLPLCSSIFKRQITSADQLTEAEAKKATDFLNKKKKVAQ